ncbi:putative pterin-4-alpha-carbinolamine dehydratase [Schistosoma haematobium]|uniref:4a-hydroxytetrahydrobiopterin dehydratase n=1 Tax=Schistosoma haematobium TaxID=6185 RepID=A0A922IL09_SCHHA|nr:putative pterin-4-alpha-carbinolamine dehydratase [Schistosoma haematobium]KAH9581117.1 putative pterin-4-alpha-carbinolamine dehydratase [Schistosoma haematobium]
MPLLTGPEREQMLPPLLNIHHWELCQHGSREAIRRSFMFKNFDVAFDFMKKIADKSKVMNHHPEWFNVYNKFHFFKIYVMFSNNFNEVSPSTVALQNGSLYGIV